MRKRRRKKSNMYGTGIQHTSVSSITQSCPALWDPMDCRTPGFPVYHQLSELTQTQIHWVYYAIQPSHPLSSLSPPTFNLSQDQGLFKWVSSSHQVAKVSEFQLQHQSFQSIFRTDFLWDGLVGSNRATYIAIFNFYKNSMRETIIFPFSQMKKLRHSQ